LEQQKFKIKHKGKKQLFENPILEKLTRTHISIPLIIFSVYSSGLIYWAIIKTGLTIPVVIGLFIIGLLFFTLVEYLMHRYVFHMIEDTPFKEKLVYRIHGVHHEYPKDKMRLAMPPVLSLTLATFLFLVFWLILGGLSFAFTPGFLMGYSLYLFVHYILHAFKPPKNFFRELWVLHSIHHFKNPEKAFGVSSPLWDYVFRTMP